MGLSIFYKGQVLAQRERNEGQKQKGSGPLQLVLVKGIALFVRSL